jgi:hypothetical protein
MTYVPTGWDLVGMIPCEEKCEIPQDVVLREVPRPRHSWNDILLCPNCPRAFIVMADNRGLEERDEG